VTRARLIVCLLTATLAFWGAACAAPDDGSTPDHVRAAVLPYLTHLPFHIAAAEGYFAEQDLDVEFVRLGRNQEIMASLAHGDLDVAAGMLTLNELNLAAAGGRLRMVAALGESGPDQCPYIAIIARREVIESGALEDPERIRHLRVDVNALMPLGYAFDVFLQPFGLTMDDTVLVDLPPPAALETLRRGDIDVTLDSEPFISRHLATGAADVYRSVADILPNYIHSVLMFGPGLIDDRPDVGRRFMVAMLQGIRQFRQGKTPRNLALAEAATGLSADQVASACWPVPSEDARIDGSVFDGYQRWSVARGLLDRVVTDDELFDHRFVEFANAQLAR
jgi:NitT/TauT family transport system substrate-binding protein